MVVNNLATSTKFEYNREYESLAHKIRKYIHSTWLFGHKSEKDFIIFETSYKIFFVKIRTKNPQLQKKFIRKFQYYHCQNEQKWKINNSFVALDNQTGFLVGIISYGEGCALGVTFSDIQKVFNKFILI